jgi:hypothetical protein
MFQYISLDNDIAATRAYHSMEVDLVICDATTLYTGEELGTQGADDAISLKFTCADALTV